MDWLTASKKDQVRAQRRLIAIHKRLLRIGEAPHRAREREDLLAERAEIYFGDKPFGKRTRKRVAKRKTAARRRA